MKFHEKLSFLMTLTQTSNKALSAKLNVDPSLISMLKTGKRKIPKNTEYINILADFFGKNCTSEYQRYSLSDAIGNENIKLISAPNQIADIIFNWLNDSSVDSLSQPQNGTSYKRAYEQGIPPPISSIDIFYTTNGRRGALSALHELIRNSPIPRAPLNTLFVSIDEDLEWVYEDDAFLKNVSQALFKLINDGMRICHIIHSNTDPYQLVQYLKLWLPLYVTGKVEVHWCYHPQPQIYRRSIILAPSSGAVFYNTANTKRDDPATLLTSDKQLMHSLTYELQSFFPFFSPVLQEVSVSDGIDNNEMPLVSKLQQTPSLSVETTPAILVQHCMEHASTQEQKELLQSHLMQSVRFEHLLQNPSFTYTDTAYIAPVQAVKKGEIKMLVSNGIHEEPVAYTPEMYTLHLQNILRLLKTYPNYNFIPAIHKIHFDFILIVQDNKEVLIIRTAPPFNSFLIKQQNIVNACSQMISNENSNYLNIHTRADIIKHLEAIIADLV